MKMFKQLEAQEIRCVARSVRESAKYVAEHRRLGVCGFKHSGLARFCYATGTYRTKIDSPNEEIEVRCVDDETTPMYVSQFYPLQFFDCPKVLFKCSAREGLGRMIGYDYEKQLCHIFEECGDESVIFTIPVSDVCLISNIKEWGE